ncbi:MAG: S1C family serine protease, partial [Candidatus Aminicenantia bacterium]
MKKKIFLIVLFLCIIGITTYLSSDNIDYIKFYSTLKNLTNPDKVEGGSSELMENYGELVNQLEHGFSVFNIFAPYTGMEKDWKTSLQSLNTYKLRLRSYKSTQIYKRAVPATVLIVAPDGRSGAGFIIDAQRRLIATNFHVTGGMKKLFVAFYNEKIQDPSKLKFYPASLIKYSAIKDIAILKLLFWVPNLKELAFEEIKNPTVGEDVHTIGHPLQLTWTYSKGMITALRNNFQFGEEEKANVIQIDASISPGNSGGPLLNDTGKVIGMATFSFSAIYAQNLNFAISNEDIKYVLALNKNEDTSKSRILKELYGKKLFSLESIRYAYIPYKIDADGDGKVDYISFQDPKTKKEEFRFLQRVEIEIEPGKK